MDNSNHIVELKIVEFQGTNAILDISDGNGDKLSWPINKLPSSIREGDTIKFKILTSHDIEDEHQAVARKLLEEMIN